MKKLFALFLGLTMLLSLLAGCSAPTAETQDVPQTDAAADTGDVAEDAAADAATEEPADEVVTLDVGLMGTSIKPVGVLVADALGYFDEEGVDINF